MKRFFQRIHAHRDFAVTVTCALGLAFVLLVLPQITDPTTTQLVAINSK